MASWPVLSVTTFLPIVGALLIVLLRGNDDAVNRNARWIALWTTLVTFAVSLVLVWRFDASSPEFQFVEKAKWLCELRQLSHGRRRHLAAVRDPDHRADAVLHRRELGSDRDPRQGIHDRVSGAGNADGRHLLGARSRALLSVLRRRPDSDVPDHRRVGRPAPGLCQLQILPLHAARLGADAARHHGDVLGGRHDRHPDAHALFLLARIAEMGVARVLCVVRGEDADVAGAYLAAGRACGGADRGLGDPGRHPAENGRLRFPALLAADVPACLGGFRAAGLRALGHRHHLHLAGRDDAGRHEEADRLFVGGAYGLCHHGHFRRHRAGHRRRHFPDGVARHRVRRALPLRRRRL